MQEIASKSALNDKSVFQFISFDAATFFFIHQLNSRTKIISNAQL